MAELKGRDALSPLHFVSKRDKMKDGFSSKFIEAAAMCEEKSEVDTREVYFLIMHFLSGGPCQRATGQLWNELLQHKLLPRRYHAWYSRAGKPSGDEDDDGTSFPLCYSQVVERCSHIQRNHLVKLLEQLLMNAKATAPALRTPKSRNLTAADTPTLLGTGPFSLLDFDRREPDGFNLQTRQLRWPYWQAGQVHGLLLRELGGGFAQHHRSPAIRAASCALAKPAVLVDRIQIVKKFRGHRNAVYCAIFDRSGEYMITGSDDRLVKLWSTESGFCLRSCRGHEGDITDLAVSSDNQLVASASNDCTICVWRLPDGIPVSVLRGHAGAVTAIAFSPRQGCEHHLLSSSDDGTCRIWDARDYSVNPRVYMPKPDTGHIISNLTSPAPSVTHTGNQILCCAFNADGTIFVTGSSDRLARVWDASKWVDEITGRPNHEVATLRGHENDVNYVQFSGCAAPMRPFPADTTKEEQFSRFKNSWFSHDNIVTCSRDGSAIIWATRPRKPHGKVGRWSKAYHLRVPPPPLPPQLPRGGAPRQRLLPTPRGVNMVVWSLDNRFVLAAIMDCRICVWNAVDGSLVHSLTGHHKSTYVLDVHPFNPRIAMSAGYDGRVIIWDIWEGHPVHIYEMGDFNLVDGNFSPDGTSIVVSDEVGQIYLLATGQGESQKDAKYDQFFLGDFRPLVRDTHGNVLDQETQLPPHQRNLQDLLCDANMIPYPEPYQSMYQQRRLGSLGIDWQPPTFFVGSLTDDAPYNNPAEALVLPSLDDSPSDRGGRMRWVEQPNELPETMDWEQDIERLTDDSSSDYSASEGSSSDADAERNLSYTESSNYGAEKHSEDEYNEETNLRRSTRNKRKAEEMTIASLKKKAQRKIIEERSQTNQDVEDTHLILQQVPESSMLTLGAQQSVQSARPKRLAARNALHFFLNTIGHGQEEEEEQEASVTGKEVYDSNDLKDQGEAAATKCGISNFSEFGRRPRSHRKPLMNKQDCRQRMTLSNANPGRQKSLLPRTIVQLEAQGSGNPARLRHSTACPNQKSDYLPNSSALLGKEIKGLSGIRDNRNSFSVESRNRNRNQLQANTEILQDKWTEESKSCKGAKHAGCSDPTFIDFCSSASDTSSSNSQSAEVFQRLQNTFVQKNLPVAEGCNLKEVKGKGLEASSAREKVLGEEFTLPYSQAAENANRDGGIVDIKPEVKVDEGFCHSSDYRQARCSEGAIQHQLSKLIHNSRLYTTFSKASRKKTRKSHPIHVSDDDETKEHLPRQAFDLNERSNLDNLPHNVSSKDTRYMPSDASNSRFGFNDSYPQEHKTGSGGAEVVRKEEQEFSDFSQFLEGEEHDCVKNEKCIQSLLDYQLANPMENIFAKCHTSNDMEDMQGMNLSNPCSDSEIEAEASQSMQVSNSSECFGKNDELSRSWSSSEQESNEESIKEAGLHARRKKRRLGELQSSVRKQSVNCLGRGFPNDGSTSKRRVRYMRSVMSQSGKETHSKRNKQKKAATIKGNIFERNYNHKRQTRRDRSFNGVKLYQWRQGRYKGSYEEQSTERREENEVISFESQKRVVSLEKFDDEVGSTQRRKGVRQSERVRHDISKLRNRWEMTREKRPATKACIRDGAGKTRKGISWLMLTEVEEGGRYIPQLWDEVAYLRQGHQEFLESRKLDEKGPWKVFKNSIQAVEFCRIIELEYVILSHMGDTSCLLTLQFSDDRSNLYGNTFQLNLSELTDFPDFLVEKSRYNAAIARRWTNRDKCQVWWQAEDGKGGSWWEGRVIAVKPKSRQFPDSPWERLVVQYKGDTSGPHTHSPWELVDPHCQRWESPCMDDVSKTHFLTRIQKLDSTNMPEDKFGMRELHYLSSRLDFLNRIPLPLTLDIIKLRLITDYYRSAQAFKHDMHVLVSNARNYFGNENETTCKVEYLAAEITDSFSPQEFFDSGSQTDGTNEAFK
eukprot:Gb_38814 [translate_table: standard]